MRRIGPRAASGSRGRARVEPGKRPLSVSAKEDPGMYSRPRAAMLLLFDIAAAAITEHDDWHTHEHFPERLAIPGFARGSRWIARKGTPRYFVMYEVRNLATLASAPYLERLNKPTPWTSKMMQSYVGMRRALCEVAASFGSGLGCAALLIRFAPDAGRGAVLRGWLAEEVLPRLVGRPGIASARIFTASLTAPMTREQQIRGKDAGLHSMVLVTGYEPDAVAALADNDLGTERFVAHGAAAAGFARGIYQHAFTLTHGESPTN